MVIELALVGGLVAAGIALLFWNSIVDWAKAFLNGIVRGGEYLVSATAYVVKQGARYFKRVTYAIVNPNRPRIKTTKQTDEELFDYEIEVDAQKKIDKEKTVKVATYTAG
jgi:hypothetical protein